MAQNNLFFGKVNLPTWISVPFGVQIKGKIFLLFLCEFYGPLHDPLYFPLSPMAKMGEFLQSAAEPPKVHETS